MHDLYIWRYVNRGSFRENIITIATIHMDRNFDLETCKAS